MSIAERFWAKVDAGSPEGCWIWTGAVKENGYGVIGRGGCGSGNEYAHRLSWELHNGPIPAGSQVCHHCDNPPCCNPAHLFLGTPGDNARDMVAKGRSLRGTRHHAALLGDDEVREIRRLWAEGGLTQTEIGRMFGASKSRVSQIVRGVTWTHLLPADWSPPPARRWSRVA